MDKAIFMLIHIRETRDNIFVAFSDLSIFSDRRKIRITWSTFSQNCLTYFLFWNKFCIALSLFSVDQKIWIIFYLYFQDERMIFFNSNKNSQCFLYIKSVWYFSAYDNFNRNYLKSWLFALTLWLLALAVCYSNCPLYNLFALL